MSIFHIKYQKYSYTKNATIDLFSLELELNMIQETSAANKYYSSAGQIKQKNKKNHWSN